MLRAVSKLRPTQLTVLRTAVYSFSPQQRMREESEFSKRSRLSITSDLNILENESFEKKAAVKEEIVDETTDILDIKRETQIGTVSKGENGIMVIIKKHHFILIIISWMLVVLVQAKTHLFHISELYEEDVLFPLIYISKGQ